MSPEEAREAMLDAAMSSVDKKNRPQWAYEFNYLTRRGFSISLASVRDHTNCERCEGTGRVCTGCGRGDQSPSCGEGWFKPCGGGSPVVWSAAPPDPESETT